MSNKKFRTDLNFARSGFFVAMGSIFNVSGKYYDNNFQLNDEDADFRAIENDWGVIGNDLETIIANNTKQDYIKE